MHHSRQSIYPGPPGDSYWATLDNCSRSLELSGQALAGATQVLQQGTYDFARLQQVVSSRRCFELITETELQSAQRAMSNEMEPQIRELVSRAEAGIEGLIKKDKTLRTKREAREAAPPPRIVVKSAPSASLAQAQRKLEQLRQEKERFIAAMDTL